jgi:hypothetical protein
MRTIRVASSSGGMSSITSFLRPRWRFGLVEVAAGRYNPPGAVDGAAAESM